MEIEHRTHTRHTRTPAAFEFAVRKQDRLPLVKVTDYAYQAPIDSILGGPLYASPQSEIKQEEPFYLPLVSKKEEESILLLPTLVQGSLDLVYPQVPLFPHVEDYLWPDFSDDADAFFAQFKVLEELASYRSESLHLPLPHVLTLRSTKGGSSSSKAGSLKKETSDTSHHQLNLHSRRRFGRNHLRSRPASLQ